MLEYKTDNYKVYLTINQKTIIGQKFDYMEGFIFENCAMPDNTGYKYEDIVELKLNDIPNNFHFEIMNCFINQIERPIDKVPFPAFTVMFSRQNDNFYVQFQLTHDDIDDEWRRKIRWVYEHFILELKNQVNIIDDAVFVELPSKYDSFYYVKFAITRSRTIGEAFNEALPKLNDLFINTDHALLGMNRFIKVTDFWKKNKYNNVESIWHEFFTTHNWVLSQCFALPFILFNDKAYAGGKDISNKNGSILDFIYRNKLYENVSILEIKTPSTAIIGHEYRDGVISISSELTGAINQLLHYKDRLQKEYYISQYNSNDSFQALNPKCILIIGSISSLTIREKQNFELFRSELKSIEIITYDELFEKISLLKELLL